MNQQQPIKYRVIGALVIIATFILAWWLLLDHDIKRFRNIKEPIPEAIVIERFDVIDIEKEAQTDSAIKTEKPQATAVEEKPEKKVVSNKVVASKPKPMKKIAELDSKGLPQAWVLQVASFGEKKNAVVLQQKLFDADFPAYVKTFNVPDGKVYRVLIGPKLSKQRAADMAKQVEKRFQLKSMIMAFKPGFEE